jgi:hypothetical protein
MKNHVGRYSPILRDRGPLKAIAGAMKPEGSVPRLNGSYGVHRYGPTDRKVVDEAGCREDDEKAGDERAASLSAPKIGSRRAAARLRSDREKHLAIQTI